MPSRLARAALLLAAVTGSDVALAQRPSFGMGGAQHDALRAALPLADGGWLLAGQENRGAGDDPLHPGSSGFVQRHDRMGRLLWRKRHPRTSAPPV